MRDDWKLDLREEITRIDRERAEVIKLMAEARRIDRAQDMEIEGALAQIRRYASESRQLEAEARKFDRVRWLIVVTAIIAGAALFGAVAAFMKLLIG
jgi:hypothetical protein